MPWQKLGRLALPDKKPEWMHSHAAVPFIIDGLENHNFLYFSCRDEFNRSHVGRLEMNSDFSRVLGIDPEPVLRPGEFGAFDEDGVTASCGLMDGDNVKIYFVGWSRAVSVPFRNAVGLAVSEDSGKNFHRISAGPIMDRSPVDPGFVGGTFVRKIEGQYRAWYISCVRWEIYDGNPRHYYHLKQAKSDDGIHWHRDGSVAIDFASPGEYAISQPSIIRSDTGYRMWFSHRGQPGIDKYRVGYARSKDGVTWVRDDTQAGIDASPSGWDSEMMCYPFVTDQFGPELMFYNGNNYGETGIGIARWEGD